MAAILSSDQGKLLIKGAMVQKVADATGMDTAAIGNETTTKAIVDADPDNDNEDANTIASALYRLSDGTGDVHSGVCAVREGTFKLREGTIEMKDGVIDLVNGAEELNDGAQELLDGVNEYDKEGIQKLKGILKDDLTEASDTFKAVTDLGKNYTSFGGKRADMEGSCVFIIKADGITVD